jgi:hypothetical protein
MSKKIRNNPLGVHLMPYCEVDGIRTFTDSEVLGFYDRMVENGTAEAVFSDGTINSRADWLRDMKSPYTFLYVVYAEGCTVAVVWLNRVERKKAYFNYSGFFSGWKRGSVEIGKHILKIIMSMKDSCDSHLFDILMGITPVSNKVAVKYMKLCGWQVVGVLPLGVWSQQNQKSEPALISYFTREEA